MSFWDGLMKGMKDVEARSERDDAKAERQESRDYARSRDALIDERYTEAQALAERVRAQATARADATDAESERRFNIDQGRIDDQLELGADATAEEQRRYEDSKTILDAQEARAASAHEIGMIKEFASLGFGGGAARASSGGGGSSSAATPTEMRDSVLLLDSELGGAQGLEDMPKSTQEFYKTFMDVPSAAHGLVGFIQAQRKEGNEVTMEDLPNLINLAGTIEGTGREAYEDFAERVNSGSVDLSDPKAFAEGLAAFQGYSPATVVWNQLDVASPAMNNADTYGEWKNLMIGQTRVALLNAEEGSQERSEIIRYQTMMESTDENVKAKGITGLWEMGVGVSIAEDMGLKGSPYMAGLEFPGDATPVDTTVTEGAVPVDMSPEPTSGPTGPNDMNPDPGVMEFSNTAELDAWAAANPEKANAMTSVSIGGVLRTKASSVPASIPDTSVASEFGIPDAPDEVAKEELISIMNNPSIDQGVKDRALEEYSSEFGYDAAKEATMQSIGVLNEGINASMAENFPSDESLANDEATQKAIRDEVTPTLGPMNAPDTGPISNERKIEMWRESAKEVTYEEYKAMSNAELREAGLPSQGLAQGAAFGIRTGDPYGYFKAPTQGPTTGGDTSQGDSEDLVAILNDSTIDLNMKIEARRVFEEKYGPQSVDAAIEMVNKSQ